MTAMLPDDVHEVYRAYDENLNPLYYGSSRAFLKRLQDHAKSAGGQRWYPDVSVICISRYATRRLALSVERALILRDLPYYNEQMYPFDHEPVGSEFPPRPVGTGLPPRPTGYPAGLSQDDMDAMIVPDPRYTRPRPTTARPGTPRAPRGRPAGTPPDPADLTARILRVLEGIPADHGMTRTKITRKVLSSISSKARAGLGPQVRAVLDAMAEGGTVAREQVGVDAVDRPVYLYSLPTPDPPQ